MAITNLGQLKSAIRDWQQDATILDDIADDLVTLSQGYLNRFLRTREMVTQVDITPVSGLFALPSDFLQVRHVAELGSYRIPLKYVSMEGADRLFPYRESGTGIFYTFIGSNIEVFPTTTNDIELTYYAKLGAFADDDASDWLLMKMPNLYLAAGQAMAAEYLKDDAEFTKQASIVDMYVKMLNAEDDGAEMGDASYTPEGFVV
jgi:hypothetical protein